MLIRIHEHRSQHSRPSTDHTPILETESDRRISSIDPQVLAIDNSEIQLPEHTALQIELTPKVPQAAVTWLQFKRT